MLFTLRLPLLPILFKIIISSFIVIPSIVKRIITYYVFVDDAQQINKQAKNSPKFRWTHRIRIANVQFIENE